MLKNHNGSQCRNAGTLNAFQSTNFKDVPYPKIRLYLIHKPLFQLLIAPLTEMNIDVKAPIGVTIIMLLSILAGWLLFKFVETPFMNIRAKLYPTNLADDSAQKIRVAMQ